MKISDFLYALIIIGLFVSGCYYDNEEELYPENTCKTNDMSYANNVLPILTDNCYSCHNQASNQGGVTLEGYSNLKTYADNGKLVNVINHEPGFPEMPQNAAQLAQCQIDKIEAWVNQGALDN
jgi:hypothetical protein